MTTSEMGRLTASGPDTHVLVRDLHLDAFFNSGQSNVFNKFGLGLIHVLENTGP